MVTGTSRVIGQSQISPLGATPLAPGIEIEIVSPAIDMLTGSDNVPWCLREFAIAVSIEQASTNVAGPFGTYFEDSNQIPGIASCTIVAGQTNITNACLGTAAFFNISQQLAPTFVQRWRIDQPWGHIQIGATELLYTLNDGSFLNNRQYIGYGAAFSGNVFPGWFGWSKDNITYGLVAGNGVGDQISNDVGLSTNFGGALNGQTVNATNPTSLFTTNRALYDSAVISRTNAGFGARIGYTHWWNDTMRSNADFSMNHTDIASLLVGTASTSNKELTLTHVNLIWSPAAFLDLGVEGAWGHRQTVSNLKGDAYTVQTSMKFRF